jgi:hypothetical protein
MDTIIEILKPTIKKPEISLPLLENDTESGELKAGGTSPLIQILEHAWKEDQISKFELSYGDEFLPKLEFTIKDKNDIISTNLANGLETIDVFIRSDNVEFEPIKNTFLILDSEKGSNGEYTFSCELYIKGIDDKAIKSYTGTSFDIIKGMCEELGLGFASNITTTNDEQNWLRLLQSFGDMMEEISSVAWFDEKSTINVWIDVYYCLNFFDLSKSYSMDKSEFDLVTETNLSKNYGEEKEPVVSSLLLSNHQNKNGTTNFIDSFKPIDKRGSIEKNIGFKRIIKTNDIDSGEYFEYFIEHEIPEKSVERTGDNIRSSFVGFTTKNTHRNYNHARIQNGINNTIYRSKGIKITQKNINTVLYNGMRIPIILVNDSANSSDMLGDSNESGMNESLSGEYIIYKMVFSYKKKTMETEIECLMIV